MFPDPLFEPDVDFAFTVIVTDLLIFSGVVEDASVISPEIDTLYVPALLVFIEYVF